MSIFKRIFGRVVSGVKQFIKNIDAEVRIENSDKLFRQIELDAIRASEFEKSLLLYYKHKNTKDAAEYPRPTADEMRWWRSTWPDRVGDLKKIVNKCYTVAEVDKK